MSNTLFSSLNVYCRYFVIALKIRPSLSWSKRRNAPVGSCCLTTYSPRISLANFAELILSCCWDLNCPFHLVLQNHYLWSDFTANTETLFFFKNLIDFSFHNNFLDTAYCLWHYNFYWKVVLTNVFCEPCSEVEENKNSWILAFYHVWRYEANLRFAGLLTAYHAESRC